MDRILCFGAPVVLGALWGAWQGRRDRFSFAVLLVAPLFSAVLITGLITGAMLAGILISALVKANLSDPVDLVTALLTLAYGIGIFLSGAVPALFGSATGQLGKLWVYDW